MHKKKHKQKHVPQRTCVGCREINPKRSMSRIVRRPGEIVIDHTGKLSGRGAYLHNQRSCWERGMNGALAHALKVELTEKDRLILQSFLDNLTDDEAPQSVNLSQKEKPIE